MVGPAIRAATRAPALKNGTESAASREAWQLSRCHADARFWRTRCPAEGRNGSADQVNGLHMRSDPKSSFDPVSRIKDRVFASYYEDRFAKWGGMRQLG